MTIANQSTTQTANGYGYHYSFHTTTYSTYNKMGFKEGREREIEMQCGFYHKHL